MSIIRFRLEFILPRCGEEMLVITNNAARAAADQFAVAKRAQGWRTNVFETGAGAGQIGTTPAAIQTFIRSRLTALLCITRATSRSWATTTSCRPSPASTGSRPIWGTP